MNSELYKVKEKSTESKQLPENDNKASNLDKSKIFLQQKISRIPRPVPQSTNQFQNRNPQQIFRQSIGPQIGPKHQLVLNNEPLLRRIVLGDSYLNVPEPEQIEEFEPVYEPVYEKGKSLYEFSE